MTTTASFALAAPAAHAVTGSFTAGNVVVYRVGSGGSALSANGTAVYLDEFGSAGGSPVQSVPLPTAANGANKPLVASGSAGSEGLLSLSADGRYLVATGYAAAVGTAGLSSSAAASVPRTVARVDAADNIDTTTALTDFADANNPRSATSADGQEFWVGGAAGGPRYAALGASTSTSLASSTYKNLRQVQDVGGQLYTSADPTKAGVTVATVGTGLPTSGNQVITNLIPYPSNSSPYGYALLTLGSGTAPDTIYVADNGLGIIQKYGLVSGSWQARGSIALSGADGLTANDVNGVVTVYATTATGLYSVTDTSGAGGTLSGSTSLIASAPANEAFRGVAFAPGTVIGSGGTPPPATPPSVTAADAGLPAALGDPTVPSTTLNLVDAAYDPGQLTVTATSSNQSVASDNGITISGTGATRTLSVSSAGAVGNATITVKVAAPDGTSGSTQIRFAVSDKIGQPTARYYSGAGNASAAVDVGGGYAVVADDENNVLRLYRLDTSGPPVKTFDFSSLFPFGTAEIDLETAARRGNVIYWGGSMSNTSSGNLAPSRSTLFATTITGSGAATSLTYTGSYTRLQADLIAWDHANGTGLGADYLGLGASAAAGVDGHQSNALNVEGMEFAGSSGTAYLSFRAPLEPTDDRHLALVVPLTNIDAITSAGNPGTVHATFGAPIFLDLGGLGVRDIKQNADGQYLIIAGTADDTNSSFVLYKWDGNPADDPQPTGTTLPQLPSATNPGSWETIVAVPSPLDSGASVELIQDDGSVVWYNDGLTSKTGLIPSLQKSVGVTFGYVPPALRASDTSITADTASSAAGQTVTYTATVAPATGRGTPTGTVDFTDSGSDITGCDQQPVSAGTATCSVTYSASGAHSISAAYSGDQVFAPSISSTITHNVSAAALDNLVVSPAVAQLVAGGSQTFSAEGHDRYGNDIGDVTGAAAFTITPTSTGSSAGANCTGSSCTATTAGTYTIAATDGAASGSAQLNVSPAAVASLTLTPAATSTPAGVAVTYTAAGSDSYGNPVGDETNAATFVLTPSGGGGGTSCAANACSTTTAGTFTVTASVATATGSATGSASLTVTPGPVTALTLNPATAQVAAGQSQTYAATGADQYGNPVGDVTAQTTFTIDGAGTCSGPTCTAPDAGVHTVTGQDGTVSGTATLTATSPTPPPKPAVTAVSPTSGPTTGGTTVTVTGTGFTGATAVLFGSVSATSFTVVSDTQLTAASPAQAAGAHNIFVTTAGGKSATVTADRFTYVKPSRPSVSSIAPNHGIESGGTTITVTGKSFDAGTTVSFGTVAAPDVTVLSSTQLRVVSPAQTPGTYDLKVTTAGGTSGAVAGDRFTFTPRTPAISSVTPATGTSLGGTKVTVTGSGFSNTTEVDFGTAAGTGVNVLSDTKLTVVSPQHAGGAVSIAVVTTTGTSASGSTDTFTYVVPAPTVLSVNPASGPTTGGTTVTITGTAFSAATQVRFGNLAATSFTVVSDTTITATSPAQASGTRTIYVVTAQGASRSGSSSAFTYKSTAPAVSSVSPASGTARGGTAVTITGVRFSAATQVLFGAVAATSFTVDSDTQITAVTPAEPAAKHSVTVTGPGGSSPTNSKVSYTFT
ncbi:beta strand repeat-containing protein [uncultured Jatrophihabitans sp.]|uniref:beta strand repeat-containing protein n=1 Tax=uncultured Jatrophihabitans sp. TaxID=1610747 RepID=UPI0035C98767